MTLRSGHGNGRGTPRIEVLPADELPKPVPAPLPSDGVKVEFTENGKITAGETARELGRRGGLAKSRRRKFIDALGIGKLAEDKAFYPYKVAAEEFLKTHLEALARMAGGYVGPGPSTFVASAAWQLAASRFALEKGAEAGDLDMMKKGSNFADQSRQNLMAAYEMATREAAARPRLDPLAAFKGPSLPAAAPADEENTVIDPLAAYRTNGT